MFSITSLYESLSNNQKLKPCLSTTFASSSNNSQSFVPSGSTTVAKLNARHRGRRKQKSPHWMRVRTLKRSNSWPSIALSVLLSWEKTKSLREQDGRFSLGPGFGCFHSPYAKEQSNNSLNANHCIQQELITRRVQLPPYSCHDVFTDRSISV